jgi:hypothetical protein
LVRLEAYLNVIVVQANPHHSSLLTRSPSDTLSLGYGNASSISLTQALADAGAISSPAVIIWDQEALFGGVNKARYNGSLYTFPIVNGSDLTKAFRINMDGISINETSAALKDFPLDAVFDLAIGMT